MAAVAEKNLEMKKQRSLTRSLWCSKRTWD
jgi:hypothetical protein